MGLYKLDFEDGLSTQESLNKSYYGAVDNISRSKDMKAYELIVMFGPREAASHSDIDSDAWRRIMKRLALNDDNSDENLNKAAIMLIDSWLSFKEPGRISSFDSKNKPADEKAPKDSRTWGELRDIVRGRLLPLESNAKYKLCKSCKGNVRYINWDTKEVDPCPDCDFGKILK